MTPGVVTRMWGGLRIMAVRCELGVSPVRTTTRTSGASKPSVSSAARISASGCVKFFCTSLLSALSGET